MSENPKQADANCRVPLQLMPPAFAIGVCAVFRHGAANPTRWEYNWRDNDVKLTTYIAAAQRHLLALQSGQDIDSETGEHHANHVGACMGIIVDARACGTLVDDRPKVRCNSAAMLKEYEKRWKAELAPPVDPAAEARKAALYDAIRVKALIEQISTRCYNEAWGSDIEFHVWESIVTGDYTLPGSNDSTITQEEAQELRALSGRLGGWVFWNDTAEEVNAVASEEWLQMLSAWRDG